MKVQLLKPDDYYTQRNNKLHASSACMPTSRVMFYLANGLKILNPTRMPHDDYITHILETEEAKEFCYSKYPFAKTGNIPPREVHGMYNSYVDPIVIGKRVSDFRTDLTWSDIMFEIGSNKAVMTSGSFPEANISGHAFCITGVDQGSLLICDPYGDFTTNYRIELGYAVKMSYIEFLALVKQPTKAFKWGHVIKEYK